ncbi:MAG: FlgD immunoglobulin-like domain containing protein, partial [Calditrichota bacterium]
GRLTSARALIDFMFYDSNLSFLGFCDYSTPTLIMKKSDDGGLTYIDSVIINTGNRSPDYCISTVKCENGDLLCFYSGGAVKQNSTYHSDIFYNRSSDLGASFSQQIKITSEYQYNSGVYADTYRNHVFLIHEVGGDTITPKIIFQRSDDNGYTFPYKKVVQNMWHTYITSHSQPYLIFKPNVGLCLIWTVYAGSVVKTWFTYSTDLGENFHPPVLVAEHNHLRWRRSMAIYDSGDVYVTRIRSQDLSIVLQKAKLPVLTGINSRQSVYQDKSQLFSYNYPNPFNESTVITFTISGTFRPTRVSLEIFDISGRRIRTLLNEPKVSGTHQVVWNGNDDNGNLVASGLYVYRIHAGNFVQSKKMLFLK